MAEALHLTSRRQYLVGGNVEIRPGQVRDAILAALAGTSEPQKASDIQIKVERSLGRAVPPSSVRSYLALNTPQLFRRAGRGKYCLADEAND